MAKINCVLSVYIIMFPDLTFNRPLNFRPHTERIYCKAIELLEFVKRICEESKLSVTVKKMYCFIVRSVR